MKTKDKHWEDELGTYLSILIWNDGEPHQEVKEVWRYVGGWGRALRELMVLGSMKEEEPIPII